MQAARAVGFAQPFFAKASKVTVLVADAEPEEVGVPFSVDGEALHEVRGLASTHDWLFTSGGVGPTHDDVTIAGVARGLDRPVVSDPTSSSRASRASRRATTRARTTSG